MKAAIAKAHAHIEALIANDRNRVNSRLEWARCRSRIKMIYPGDTEDRGFDRRKIMKMSSRSALRRLVSRHQGGAGTHSFPLTIMNSRPQARPGPGYILTAIISTRHAERPPQEPRPGPDVRSGHLEIGGDQQRRRRRSRFVENWLKMRRRRFTMQADICHNRPIVRGFAQEDRSE